MKNNLTIAVKLCDQVPLHSVTSSFRSSCHLKVGRFILSGIFQPISQTSNITLYILYRSPALHTHLSTAASQRSSWPRPTLSRVWPISLSKFGHLPAAPNYKTQKKKYTWPIKKYRLLSLPTKIAAMTQRDEKLSVRCTNHSKSHILPNVATSCGCLYVIVARYHIHILGS